MSFHAEIIWREFEKGDTRSLYQFKFAKQCKCNHELIFKVDSGAGAVAAEEAASETVAAARPYPLLRRAGLLRPAGPAEDWPHEAENWSGKPNAAAAAAVAVGGTGGTATATAGADLKGGTTAGGRPRRRRTGRGIATETEETREGDVQIVTTVSLV